MKSSLELLLLSKSWHETSEFKPLFRSYACIRIKSQKWLLLQLTVDKIQSSNANVKVEALLSDI